MAIGSVETAVLKLIDKTSAPATKIDTVLSKLFATASKLNMRANISVTSTGVAQVTRDLKAATAAANNYAAAMRRAAGLSVKPAKMPVPTTARQLPPFITNPKAVTTAAPTRPRLPPVAKIAAPQIDMAQVTNLNALTRALQAYSRAARAVPPAPAINPRVRAPLPAAAPIPARSPVPRIPRPAPQGGGGGGISGLSFRSNIGGGFSVVSAFGAVAAAAHLAAAGLRSVATNAASRDRTQLQMAVQASAAQREVFRKAGDRPEGLGPIAFTKDERDRFRTSLLGDVQGNETQRATGAVNLATELERSFLPRLFAQSPDKSREDIQGDLRAAVQTMNLASAEAVDATGKMTADGQRVMNAMIRARAADPDIDFKTMRTVAANLKTAGFALSEDALAKVFINAGSRGQRVANETFRAIQTGTGTVDVKVLNNKLSELGLLEDVKRNAKGNVIAGSGTPVDSELLNTDPSVWFNKHYLPKLEAQFKKANPGQDMKASDTIAGINRDFAGATGPAKQAIADFILGEAQMKATLDQSRLANEQNVSAAVGSAWTSQAEGVGAAFKDQAAALGASFMQSIGAADIFKSLSSIIRGEPTTPGQAAAVVGAGVVGTGAVVAGGVAAARALSPLAAPATQLTTAGTSLQAAAGALTNAARAQAVSARGGSVPSIPGQPGGQFGGRVGGSIPNPEGPSTRFGISQSVSTAVMALNALTFAANGASDAWTWFNQTPEQRAATADKNFTDMQATNDSANAAIAAITPTIVAQAAEAGTSFFAPMREGLSDLLAGVVGKRAAEVAVGPGSKKDFVESGSPAGDTTGAAVATLTVEMKALQVAMLDRTEAQNTIASLETQIANNKAKEKLAGTSDIINQPLQTQLAEAQQRASAAEAAVTEARSKTGMSDDMIAQWSATWAAGGASINTSLVTGAESLRSGIDGGMASGAIQIAAAGNQLGSTAGGIIAGFGAQLGQAAASAISAAVSNISVKATVAQGANVGSTKTTD